jgi:hypothetical protein
LPPARGSRDSGGKARAQGRWRVRQESPMSSRRRDWYTLTMLRVVRCYTGRLAIFRGIVPALYISFSTEEGDLVYADVIWKRRSRRRAGAWGSVQQGELAETGSRVSGRRISCPGDRLSWLRLARARPPASGIILLISASHGGSRSLSVPKGWQRPGRESAHTTSFG